MGNVLIVEDNETVRELLDSCVSRLGYNPHLVGNGEEALVRLGNPNGYRLIIRDLNMPKLSGIELYQGVRKLEHYRTSPFLFVSANPSQYPELMDILGQDVRTRFLSKPFGVRSLKNSIEELI